MREGRGKRKENMDRVPDAHNFCVQGQAAEDAGRSDPAAQALCGHPEEQSQGESEVRRLCPN